MSVSSPLAADRRAQAHRAVRIVPTPSGQIEVWIEGEGPSAVMIPSLGRGVADFDDLAHRLVDEGFQVLRPQPRGVGASAGAMSEITLHDLAADVACAIEALGSAPAMVVAHAFGQRVARVLAADRPDLVSGIAMLAAGGKIPPLPGAQEALAGVFRTDLPDAERMEHIRFAFFAPGNDPAVWREGWYRDTARAQQAAGRATPVDGWWNAGAATPLLIVQGLQDTIAPPENGHLMQRELGARVELLDIDGAGHALLPEQPDAIARAVIAFARRVGGGASRHAV
jgi:pimeloyl-ACP methyl ester carboxylesterase